MKPVEKNFFCWYLFCGKKARVSDHGKPFRTSLIFNTELTLIGATFSVGYEPRILVLLESTRLTLGKRSSQFSAALVTIKYFLRL